GPRALPGDRGRAASVQRRRCGAPLPGELARRERGVEPMMRLREAAAAMGGELRGADRAFGGVSTDTRALGAGELFFALKGERFDAVQFVDEAFAAEAAGAVVPAHALSEA